MLDRLAFGVMQVISLFTAIVLTFIAKYINDAEKNLEIEAMAMSNWFLFYSTLEDLPPEVRSRILLVGKFILISLVIILIKVSLKGVIK